ncbi:hypothetical protein AGMMS50218_11750 [Actinomycetota bacterium]|nr:hypothetical protein AGMMS50218_11750 [Actinomycetota bacterium]
MSTQRGRRALPRPVRVWLAAAAVLAAVVVHLAAQAGMMLRWAGWDGTDFRSYYWSDQLAYLAIATNAAHGDLSSVEPLTQTGTIYYPRAYYLALGTVAHLTGTHAATMWTVLGLLAQAVLVAMVGGTCVLLTRRWWVGLVGFTPFLLGTFSWLDGSWVTPLGSHAVLWGPFGVLFTLNGESVALCVAGVALLALLLVASGRVPHRLVRPLSLAACLTVGLLASVQTYSFLVSVFLLAGCAAAIGLVRAPARRDLAWTGVLLVLVLAAGPFLAEHVGPLATLAAALLPALPGLLSLVRVTGRWVLWCAAAVVAGAAPQVLVTVFGILGDDPFLLYRDSSSRDLGVPWPTGLLAAGAALPALVLVAVVGWRRRAVLWAALPVALAVVWALLATNDRWGANQEPYRFWLDTYVLVAVLLVPLGTWVAVDTWARRTAATEPAARPGATVRPLSRRGRVVTLGAVLAVVAVAAASGPDWLLFRQAAAAEGYLRLAAPQYVAAAQLADETGGGLVLTDTCLDPLFLKATWGGPVAAFNRGLAWPDHLEAIEVTLAARAAGVVDESAAGQAGVRWVLTSTACSTSLALPDDVVRVGALDFAADGPDAAGTVALWRLPG